MKRLIPLALVVLVAAGCIYFWSSQQAVEPAPEAAVAVEAAAPPQAAPADAADATAAEPAGDTPDAASPGAAANDAAPAERIELAQADFSAVEAAGFVEGRHYRRLSPAQATTTSPDTVEVNEFFMYSCIHCYNLEPYVEAWLEDKPDYIEFVPVPTTWNPVVAMHAQAYYAAEALGKLEEMHWPFFREMHVNNNFLQTPEAMADFFERFDVSNEEFESVFDSFAVHTKVNRATELGRRYRVDSTPTIIVNGKYTTGVGMADPVEGNPERLFELIELLAQAELGR